MLTELRKPPSPAERVLGHVLLWGGMFGPLVVGIGLPVAVALLLHREGVGSFIASIGLPIGLYMLELAVIGGGFSRVRGNDLANVPVGKVRARADGDLVMVEGRVSAGSQGTIEGELTGKPWLWSVLTLTTYRPGMRGPVPDVTRRSVRLAPFTVDDGDGPIEVDAQTGILRAAPHQLTARLGGGGAPRVRALLEQERIAEPRAGAEAQEWSLAEGDRVVVLGVVQRGDAYRGGLRLGSGLEDQLVVTGETRTELIRSEPPSRGLAIASVLVTLGCLAALFALTA